jgi:hypothetical protein
VTSLAEAEVFFCRLKSPLSAKRLKVLLIALQSSVSPMHHLMTIVGWVFEVPSPSCYYLNRWIRLILACGWHRTVRSAVRSSSAERSLLLSDFSVPSRMILAPNFGIVPGETLIEMVPDLLQLVLCARRWE